MSEEVKPIVAPFHANWAKTLAEKAKPSTPIPARTLSVVYRKIEEKAMQGGRSLDIRHIQDGLSFASGRVADAEIAAHLEGNGFKVIREYHTPYNGGEISYHFVVSW